MTTATAPLLCLALLAAAPPDPREAPVQITYRVTGLFGPERVPELREAFERIPNVTLVDVDFEAAEATLEFIPAKALPGDKHEQYAQGLDNRLKGVSSHTFGVKPRGTLPKEKRVRVEIPVAGLDCAACNLAAYECVARIDGVEAATASFRDRRVVAWIDPEKTDRARLEAALKQLGAQILAP